LGRLRSHELRPTSLVVNTLLRATDRLKELIDQVESSNGQDVSRHITDLEKILAGEIDDVEVVEVNPSSVDQRPPMLSGRRILLTPVKRNRRRQKFYNFALIFSSKSSKTCWC
jgi:hypothetical protein